MLLTEENGFRGYRIQSKIGEDGAVKIEMWQDDPNEEDPNSQWKKIGEWDQAPKREWNPPSDHQETIRDDLGLFAMLNNFDKVKEKLDKGQKEVYQDGWSIAPIDHKIPDDIPHKEKENPLGWKWISLREIKEEDE